jgi:hypothetical protein
MRHALSSLPTRVKWQLGLTILWASSLPQPRSL